MNPNHLIKQAAQHNDHEEVARLVYQADAGSIAVALNRAAEKGHVECLRVLFAHTNENGRLSALGQAARCNHTDAIRFFVQCYNEQGKKTESMAIRWSIQHKNQEMFLLLIPHCDIELTRAWVRSYENDKEFVEQCLAQYEKNIILQQLPDASCPRQARKI